MTETSHRPLSPSEAAGLIGCSVDTVRRACAAGDLGYKFRGCWYIRRSEVEAILRGAAEQREERRA